MLRVITWGVLLFASVATAATLPETPLLRGFDVAEGLPSNHVNALAQDAEGYLWLATADGLARYDGLDFRVWRHAAADSDALPGNVVQALHIDPAGRIWVGVEGAGLHVLDRDLKRFRHYRRATHPQIGSDEVFDITSTRDGALWFGTYGGGVHRLDRAGGITRFMPDAGGLPSENVLYLATDAHGTLWAGTTAGAAHWNGRRFESLDVPGIAGEWITGFSLDRDDALWIGTRAGLFRRAVDGAITPAPWSFRGVTTYVYSVLHDRGGYWLATSRGLQRVRDGQTHVQPVAGRFGHDSIFDLLRDHEGGLWFAAFSGGLAYLPPDWQHFAVFAISNEASSVATVQGLAAGNDGAIWMTSGPGALLNFNPATGHTRRIEFPVTFTSSLWALRQRRDGSLWIGRYGGLVRVSSTGRMLREWTPTSSPDATLPGPLDLLTETVDGRLWSSSLGGGIQARDADGRVLLSIVPGDGRGLEASDTEQLAPGPDSALWLAGPQGLLRWDEGQRRFAHIAGAPRERVFGFAVVGTETLWLHRLDALERYDWDGHVLTLRERVDAADGLPAVESGSVLVVRNAVWLTTARGLLRWDIAAQRLRRYGMADGLPSHEFANHPALLTTQGLAAAVTGNGIVLFDADHPAARAKPPRLVIETLEVRRGEDVRALDPMHSVVLGPEDRDLRITARLLSYVDPQAHRYRFKLDGYDPDWVVQPANGERMFSRLEPGEYRLAVQAANPDAVWSAPRGFELRVLPPWWRTLRAYAAYVLLALMSLCGAGVLYRRRLKRRHAVQMAEQRRTLAEHTSQAKTRFLATLGHEIRTPLTGVLGMSELLLHGGLPEHQRGQVEAIHGAGEHLLRLVNDALDLARIEAGKLALNDAPFDLLALIEEVRALLAPLAQRKGLEFGHEIDADAPRGLRGDAHRLRQILLNLGHNAIKFTEHGGVSLRVCALAPSGVRLQMRDSGPGLNAEQRDRLFERFMQVDGPRTSARHGGSGLGLAICRELTAAMGGRIEVDSAPGVGTTFRVDLPLPVAEIDARPARPAPPSTAAASAPRHILLVEDEVMVARVVVGLLQALGHSVEHAPHGLAALTRLQGERYDLALVDLDLPGVDGLELTRLIRGNGNALPLIAFTARADADAEPQSRAAGMDGFLRKPVTTRMLAEAIDAAVQVTGPIRGLT